MLGYAYEFMQDVASRLTTRVQLTTDGRKPYLSAVEDTFGTEIDYAQLVKIYGTEQMPAESRYSPPKCLGARPYAVNGDPIRSVYSAPAMLSAPDLTMRLMNRRFTRLTLGFSKKVENYVHALALYAFHYNFCKIHKTLRCTPAMEAGVTTKLWEIKDIVALLG